MAPETRPTETTGELRWMAGMRKLEGVEGGGGKGMCICAGERRMVAPAEERWLLVERVAGEGELRSNNSPIASKAKLVV